GPLGSSGRIDAACVHPCHPEAGLSGRNLERRVRGGRHESAARDGGVEGRGDDRAANDRSGRRARGRAFAQRRHVRVSASLGLALRKQAAQVGMDKAEVWIGLTDGGNGLEDFVRRNFPRDPVLILDFWHASAYLTELGQVLYPADEETRQRVVGDWCRMLKRA